MITKLHIENFKCFKNFDIELGLFNVLVGPNDTGKTTLLQAIQILAITSGNPDQRRNEHDLHRDMASRLGKPLGWQGKSDSELAMGVTVAGTGGKESALRLLVEHAEFFVQPVSEEELGMTTDTKSMRYRIRKSIGDAAYYSLSADRLREPSALMSKGVFSMDCEGRGFPTFLEDILRADRESFFRMEQAFNDKFPAYVVQIQKLEGNNHLAFRMSDGQIVSAKSISDGALLYLAFLAITSQPSPPAILLIEEPENGVHHGSLKSIVETVRDFSKARDVQVIMTTHSPYLLDLVEPEDVRVFSKDAEGAVHAAKLSDFPDAIAMKKHFMSGEIWTSFKESDIVDKARETK